MDLVAAARACVNMVYGEPVLQASGDESAAARRVMSIPGMTVDTVRLMMLIVGSSPRYWAPMFETACARGWGVRQFEKQLAGLRLALSRDPSAPGNRAGEEAYHEKPKTPEDVEILGRLEKTRAQLVAETQGPWLELIDEAKALGLRGPRLFDWVMTQRSERTGRPRSDYPSSQRIVPPAKPSPDANEPRTHWTESADARDGGGE